MAIEKHVLKKLLNELSKIKGRHTELVSVYVPSGYNLAEITNLIKQEQSTAENIKSKTTRKNVLGALERAAGRLKFYHVTPPNGLVIFSGNISEKEGVTDLRVWELEPPDPIATRIYRCDQTFVLQPLLDQIREKEIYGLVVMDTSEAAIGFLKGKSISVAKKLKSIVPGKQIKGGQSAARFQRVREGLLLSWEKEVGEVATKIFEQEKDLKGLLIGGPGIIKNEFFDGPFLSEALKKKVIGIRDLGYSGEEGFKELIERSQDLLKESELMREKVLLNRFFEHLQKDTGLVVYGMSEVQAALERGAVDTLILSEGFEMKAYDLKCTSCTYSEKKILKAEKVPKSCPSCTSALEIVEKDITEELGKAAKAIGASLEVVSTDTPEGTQFLQLGGISALLRFRID